MTRTTKAGAPDRRAQVAQEQAAAMTPEERTARAAKAAEARWDKPESYTVRRWNSDGFVVTDTIELAKVGPRLWHVRTTDGTRAQTLLVSNRAEAVACYHGIIATLSRLDLIVND